MLLFPALCREYVRSDLPDFAPLWIRELANDRGLPVVIHLSHYQNMLNDDRNIAQFRFVSVTYPNAKIVPAHCAMEHHSHKLKPGQKKINDLKNIRFDCSGSAEALSIYYCLKPFGVDRMTYGAKERQKIFYDNTAALYA